MTTGDNLIPNSYEQWRECIVVRCGLTLSRDFIGRRLAELKDPRHPKTVEFSRRYGEEQLKLTIGWFERAGSEVEARA